MDKVIPIKAKQFEKVFDENFSRIYSYVYFKIGNHAEAEDLTADVFAKAFEHYDRFNPERHNIYTWLRAIAHNAVVDYYRKSNRITPNGQEILGSLPSEMDVESDYLDQDTAQRLLRHIKDLSESQQEILSLKYFMGMTNREISKAIGLSESNVGTILHRMIRRLKADME